MKDGVTNSDDLPEGYYDVACYETWSRRWSSYGMRGLENLEQLIGHLALNTPPVRKTGIKIATKNGRLLNLIITPVGESGEEGTP